MSRDAFDFTGANALVIGGSSGLGNVMAAALLDHGATVCIASRSGERVEAAVSELAEGAGERVSGAQIDLTDEASVGSAVGDVAGRLGGLNIVVNSAGANVRNRIGDITLDEWEYIQRTNSTGAFLLARAAYPVLAVAEWGRLIFVTSIFSSVSYPERSSYSSSKGAMIQLARTLALEWAPDGITVNTISPGPFLTELNRPVLDDQEKYRQFCRNIPLDRFGDPPEVATSVLFLASPNSGYVTGSDVFVDGGWTAR